MTQGFTDEDIREALAAVERWGGVDSQCSEDGDVWLAVNPRRAMLKGIEAALRSRARRESREAMDALESRVAAHQNRVLLDALEVLR